MKVKKIFIQIIAMLMCVITLSFSIGGKFCFYNNIERAHAAGTVTITLGSLALEEIILSIAIAVLGAEVAYHYRDEIIDSYKEYSENGSTLYTKNNLMEVYYNGEYYSLTWDDYAEMLKGMGSTASESFDDYKEKFNNTYVKPAKEYLQYVADFYTRLFTTSPTVGADGYIAGLSEYLEQEFFTSYDDIYISDAQMYKTIIFKSSINNSTGTIQTYSLDTLISQRLHLEGDFTSGFWLMDDESNPFYVSVKNVINYLDGKPYSSDIRDIRFFSTNTSMLESVFYSNLPIFSSREAWKKALASGDYSSALNYDKSMDAIAIPGDDIPTVGNWEELWERLKNPDLPWWFCNPDALGLANAADLPWFDVAGLHDWANDIPSIKDGIIDTNPDIPWTDVWDKVINIPDVVIPAIDFPYVDVDDPAKPKPTTEPTTKPTPSPGEIDSAQPVVDLSKFFPFCIPFDLIHLIQALDAEPVAPKWILKLEPPQFPVEWEVVLDLSEFETLAKIFRTGETLLFVIGLILITRGIIKG